MTQALITLGHGTYIYYITIVYVICVYLKGGLSLDNEGIWRDDGDSRYQTDSGFETKFSTAANMTWSRDYDPYSLPQTGDNLPPESSSHSANISEFEASESVHEGGNHDDDQAIADSQSLQSIDEYDYPELRDENYMPSDVSRKDSEAEQAADDGSREYGDYDEELERYDNNEEDDFDEFGLPAVKYVTKEGRYSQPQFREVVNDDDVTNEDEHSTNGLPQQQQQRQQQLSLAEFETLEGALKTLDYDAADNRDLVAAYLEKLQNQEEHFDGDDYNETGQGFIEQGQGYSYNEMDLGRISNSLQQQRNHHSTWTKQPVSQNQPNESENEAYYENDRSRNKSPGSMSEEAFSIDIAEGTEGSVRSIEDVDKTEGSMEYAASETEGNMIY